MLSSTTKSAAVFLAIMEVSGFENENHVGIDFIQSLEWSLSISMLMPVQFLCVS